MEQERYAAPLTSGLLDASVQRMCIMAGQHAAASGYCHCYPSATLLYTNKATRRKPTG